MEAWCSSDLSFVLHQVKIVSKKFPIVGTILVRTAEHAHQVMKVTYVTAL